MKTIPIVGFAAWSGTGKTTLIEALVAHLTAQGVRVAVIKHDAHRFEIDREGKDSWRFTQAGAAISIVSSAEKTALIESRPMGLAGNPFGAGSWDSSARTISCPSANRRACRILLSTNIPRPHRSFSRQEMSRSISDRDGG